MTDKVKEGLLKEYKRANQARKQKLAEKLGFKTKEEYLAYLEDKEIVQEVEDNIGADKPTDIVIAFDVTGSMVRYIENVKNHVIELIPTLFENTRNLRIKIVAFGDYCDMVSKGKFEGAYQEIELTNNVEDLIHFVKHAKNTCGGDEDEFYELVLHKIKNETSWRKDSNKSILLIGDCGPHKLGYSFGKIIQNNLIDWRREAKDLKELGIKVDTLSLEGYSWYKELSEITGGIHLLFESSSKTSQLMEGYTYARSGSKDAFKVVYDSVTESGDDELIGTYKQMGELL